jgi:hypothetical protein
MHAACLQFTYFEGVTRCCEYGLKIISFDNPKELKCFFDSQIGRPRAVLVEFTEQRAFFFI